MPIIHEYKAIYFHIGKTGGVAIERELGIPASDYKIYQPDIVYGLHEGVMTQHARPRYVESKTPPETYKDYFKFTFVRNPWDRMVSAYYYLYRINIKQHGSFEAWLINNHEHVVSKNYREGSHMIPQTEYTHSVTDKSKKHVDFIGRYENIQTDFNTLCEHIGKDPNDLRVLNNSGSRPAPTYREHYNEFTKQLVQEMYQDDIDILGYEF